MRDGKLSKLRSNLKHYKNNINTLTLLYYFIMLEGLLPQQEQLGEKLEYPASLGILGEDFVFTVSSQNSSYRF